MGFSAAALVGPSGRVIVSDFAGAMVDVACRRTKQLVLGNVECRVLDAEHLELPDRSVDAVLCRWGYMLMADPAAALRETRRVLRARGRVVCAVFAGPERNPWAALPSQLLQQHGHIPPPEAGAPGIFALADPDHLRRLFAEAGLAKAAIDEVEFGFRFAGADEYWAFLNEAAGAIAMNLGRLGHGERERIRREIGDRLGAFAGWGHVELPATSLVVSAYSTPYCVRDHAALVLRPKATGPTGSHRGCRRSMRSGSRLATGERCARRTTMARTSASRGRRLDPG